LDFRRQTGALPDTNINVRDVPHGSFKVVGDRPAKLLPVHIVDKASHLTTSRLASCPFH
jgi:hypothetical protein